MCLYPALLSWRFKGVHWVRLPLPHFSFFFVKMGVVFLSFRVCIPVTNPSLFISSTRRCKQSWQATRLSGSAEESMPGWGLFYTGSARADWRLNLWMNKEKHWKTFGCWSDVVPKVPPLNHLGNAKVMRAILKQRRLFNSSNGRIRSTIFWSNEICI